MLTTLTPKRRRALGIIDIEMHERDKKVRDWIEDAVTKNGGQAIKLTHVMIAERFGCTRITARNIVNRLVAAGYIKASKSSKKEGYHYHLE